MHTRLIQTVALHLATVITAASCTNDSAGQREMPVTSAAAGAPSKSGMAGYVTKCDPACTGSEHCELLLQQCGMASCPWVPTCVDGIDPCATVSCPSVCVVASDHRHRCVTAP